MKREAQIKNEVLDYDKHFTAALYLLQEQEFENLKDVDESLQTSEGVAKYIENWEKNDVILPIETIFNDENFPKYKEKLDNLTNTLFNLNSNNKEN